MPRELQKQTTLSRSQIIRFVTIFYLQLYILKESLKKQSSGKMSLMKCKSASSIYYNQICNVNIVFVI